MYWKHVHLFLSNQSDFFSPSLIIRVFVSLSLERMRLFCIQILMLCCMAVGGRWRANKSIFLTCPAKVDQEMESVHPQSLVLMRGKIFVFGVNSTILDYFQVKCSRNQFSVLLKAMRLFFLPYYCGVCVGTFQYRDKVYSFDFDFILGCSAPLKKWHLRDLNVVLGHNSRTFNLLAAYLLLCRFFFSPDIGCIK